MKSSFSPFLLFSTARLDVGAEIDIHAIQQYGTKKKRKEVNSGN